MKKIMRLLFSLFIGNAYAAPMDERAAVCYVFAAGKLKTKAACILSSGYGAGGSYESAQIGKQTFNAETSTCYDEKRGKDVVCDTSLNDHDAKHYYRDLFYQPITDASLIDDRSLSCYITKDRKTDVCFK